MLLHFSPTSPYVRKVMIVARETGLVDRITLETRAASPVRPDEALSGANPLGKVPALETEDGLALFDSPVVCEYLDSLHDGAKIFPNAGRARWTALQQQALGDGLLDAALLVRYEMGMRPRERQWADWEAGQRDKMARALSVMEGQAQALGDTITIGTITFACALGYLDFRFADDNWRDKAPTLAGWFSGFEARPSYRDTAPPSDG
ncbi:MAG: glutathione S-transferase N-terminal domain-containing protein [Pseudomonadota bacterium]